MADHRNGKPSDCKAARTFGAYSIHVYTFTMRLKLLYSIWSEQESDLWGTSHALAIATPLASEDLRYLKSSALNIWLLVYEFPKTIMVFMEKQIHFMCSQKVCLLEVVEQPSMEVVGVETVMHVKSKNDSGTAQMDAIFRDIRAQSKDTPVVGYIAREVREGKLFETWAKNLKDANF